MGHIGATMLFFLLYFTLIGIALGILQLFTNEMRPVTGTIVYEITYGVLYAVAFLAPAIYFYGRRGRERGVVKPYTTLTLPRETPLLIFAGIAIITAAAYLNSFMVSFMNYGEFANEVLWNTDISENYQLVLMLFTTAVVPAFVEEFLFRGVVLTNLLPYGRVTAIIASALLFGVMHQNVQQLFYATVAGVVFGFIYVQTRSIWCCVLLHFCNNFLSIINTAVSQRMEPTAAGTVLYVMELAIFALGAVSAVVLLLRAPRRETLFDEGCFEKELPPDPDYAEEPIAPARRVRLFFTPSMVVFLVICAIEMLALVSMAMTY